MWWNRRKKITQPLGFFLMFWPDLRCWLGDAGRGWRGIWLTGTESCTKHVSHLLQINTQLAVLWCFVHVCFVQVTILKLVWRSRRASAQALSYWYLFCDPKRWDNSRKLHAPRRVSTSGAPQVVTWTKQTCRYITTVHPSSMFSPATV